jgi:hypothetical protein
MLEQAIMNIDDDLRKEACLCAIFRAMPLPTIKG